MNVEETGEGGAQGNDITTNTNRLKKKRHGPQISGPKEQL